MVLCVELPNGMLCRFESASLRILPADNLPEGFERYGNGIARFQDLPADVRASSVPAGYVAYGTDFIRAFHAQGVEAEKVSERLNDAAFDEAYALGISEAAKATGGDKAATP